MRKGMKPRKKILGAIAVDWTRRGRRVSRKTIPQTKLKW